MLTIKSDDINGRAQSYEAIVKQKRIKRPNMPESFNVLLRELQAINLKIDLMETDDLEREQAEQAERYLELDRLEGQYMVDLVDMQVGESEKPEESDKVTTSIEDENE